MKKHLKTSKKKFELFAEPAKSATIELTGEATLESASADAKGPRRFSMTAYTGGPMRPKTVPPFPHPIVVDLAGMNLTKQRFPALRDHDPKQLVGHTDRITCDGKTLQAEGVMSGTGAAAVEILAANDNGFTWQVSMGAEFDNISLVPAGKSAQVNARTVNGPVFIARKGRLRELSFLTLGADDDTAATIAAEAAYKGEAMSFTDWLKANGFQIEAELTDGAKTILHAAFEAGNGAELEDAQKTYLQACVAKAPKSKKQAKAIVAAAASEEGGNGETPSDALVEIKAELTTMRRSLAIQRLCGEQHIDLAAKALEKNWDDEMIKTAIEAADLKASIGKPFSMASRPKDAPADAIVLEAALAQTVNVANLDKHYDQKVLNEVARRFPRRVGFMEAHDYAARLNGYTGSGPRQDMDGVVMAACPSPVSMRAAAFSTVSIPNILSNVANKVVIDAFMGEEQVWRMFASTRSVSDFKPYTRYRLSANFVYDELPPDGEIHHGTVSEEDWDNQLKTHGKMFAITRQMRINDDLGAFMDLMRMLGRGGALALIRKFWAKFLDHASFFTSGNSNYISGAGTALGIAGLTAALTAFRRQTDQEGNPISVTPAVLLVPPELEATALTLMTAAGVNTGGAATETQVPNTNIYSGRFSVVVSSYLTDPAEWYLIARPTDLPLIEVAFLNGQERPIVEQGDTDFNTLGTQMRGYYDFGVSDLMDTRAAIKANGT